MCDLSYKVALLSKSFSLDLNPNLCEGFKNTWIDVTSVGQVT